MDYSNDKPRQEQDLSKLGFWEFYHKHYLPAHSLKITKIYHVLGNLMTLLYIAGVIWAGFNLHWIAFGYLFWTFEVVYPLAHYSHKVYEKNKPLGLTYKWKSKISDWVMCFQLLTFQLKWDGRN